MFNKQDMTGVIKKISHIKFMLKMQKMIKQLVENKT